MEILNEKFQTELFDRAMGIDISDYWWGFIWSTGEFWKISGILRRNLGILRGGGLHKVST